MNTQLEPINWNDLDDLDEASSPFSVSDQACLDEIRQVLERNGKTRRFGITLLHKHFDLANDEVLLETPNPTDRTLSTRVMKVSELEEVSHDCTAWRFDGGTIRPMWACAGGEYGSHYGYKD